MKTKRVAVIGLDGATWDYIRPAMEKGLLPNIKKLVDRSATGYLRSTIPPITPTAWSTFSTGVNPGLHGVYNFAAGLEAFNDGKAPRLVTSRAIRAPVIWEILSRINKRVAVINVPLTYPPSPVNGIMITGMMTPGENVTFTYPENLMEDHSLVEGLGPYRLDHNPVHTNLADKDLDEWLEDYFEIEEQRVKYTVRILEKEPWDFFMVVLGITDRIGHLFWQFMDQEGSEGPEVPESFRNAVPRAYEIADRAVGKLVDAAGDDAYIMLMSDHGFGRVDRLFIANCWLEKEGFLVLRKPNLSNFKEIYHIAKIEKPLLLWLAKLGLINVAKKLPRNVLSKLIPIWLPRRVKSRYAVDWSKTRAYAHGYGITANLVGREPFGIVNPGEEHKKLLREIASRLEVAEDYEQGGKLVEQIWFTSELYKGDHNKDAPDILFRMKGDTISPVSGFDFKKYLTPNPHKAGHFLHGIFSLKGEGILSDIKWHNYRIQDLAPTIFHLMGLSVPEHMEGIVLEELFDSRLFPDKPEFKPVPSELFENKTDEDDSMSEQERELISEKLRGLGYLS